VDELCGMEQDIGNGHTVWNSESISIDHRNKV
jgi:hypothetical protein